MALRRGFQHPVGVVAAEMLLCLPAVPQTCLKQQERFSTPLPGGRDINLFLTSPPGSADNVPGAAQSPDLLRVGCSGLRRPGEKLGSRKYLDSYIMPSRYRQSLPAGPAPDPHSGSGTEDLKDRRGFERRQVGRHLLLPLSPCSGHQSPKCGPHSTASRGPTCSTCCFPMLNIIVSVQDPRALNHTEAI